MGFKVKDHFFKKAKQDNYLARSIYKLEEIDNKYSVLKKGDLVLDLGYYPGSWVQYTVDKVGENGHVIGVDIQDVNETLNGHDRIQLYCKDINEIESLSDLGVATKFDVVLSDMAPKTTGVKSVDQARSQELVELVFYRLKDFLQEGGNAVAKVFEGPDFGQFLANERKNFEKISLLRPKSTRSVSKEIFVIAKGYMKKARKS